MNGEDIVAAVVAVVSFQEAFKAVQQQRSSRSAQELLDAGLPVLFDEPAGGRAGPRPGMDLVGAALHRDGPGHPEEVEDLYRFNLLGLVAVVIYFLVRHGVS